MYNIGLIIKQHARGEFTTTYSELPRKYDDQIATENLKKVCSICPLAESILGLALYF